MTSRNLYFKLMLEDLKRRVWTIALTILSMMFSILIPVAIKCSEYTEKVDGWSVDQKRRMVSNIVELLGMNGFVVFFLVVSAVLWAVSGFQYLHNSKKVDFYHSVPVKRHVLFITKYLNGILVPAVTYLVFLVPSVFLAYRTGIGNDAIGMIPWEAFGINVIYYSLIYTTTVVAMMMTGNLVVALLGTGVFCGYLPAVVALTRAYHSMWFHTFYEEKEQMEKFYRLIKYSSPFSNYMYAISDYAEKKLSWGMLVGAGVVTILLAVLSYVLYRIRPSEAAGKAMAFKKTKMPIKVLIVVPVALACGMLFYALRDTILWLIFGTVCGVILVHCLMEIIYHFDFRKLFSNKIHLAGCMVVSIVLSLAGYYDWYGYDSWIPDAGMLEDAAMVMGYDDDWVTYGAVSEPNSIGARYWEYESMDEYVFANMHLTDLYSVMEISKKGVESDQFLRQGGEYGNNYTMFLVQFRMKDGKKAVRRYRIPLDGETREIRALIHDSHEYKEGILPILKQTAAETAKVNFQQYDYVKNVEMKYDEMAQLLDVYKKELEGLTMDIRTKELPIGTIQFMTQEVKEACESNYKLNRYGNDLENRCYYPVYPSFTRTLEILEDKGIVPMELNDTTISNIQIYYYERYDVDESELTGYEGKRMDYKEEQDIQALLPALCYHDYYHMNPYYPLEIVPNVEVSAEVEHPERVQDEKNLYNEYYFGFYLDKRCLSEETLKAYGLDMAETKSDREQTVVTIGTVGL